jgi:thiamine pyrophosphokinase
MPFDISLVKGPYVLFGNGELPAHTIPNIILKSAGTILCADGGANKLKRLGFRPDFILGDLDSLADNYFNCNVIELKDQSKTDLEKSLDWCFENGITEMSLLGFSGQDDDHWMAALWTLISYDQKMALSFYSNHSRIISVDGDLTLDSFKGQTISLIPAREKIKITANGLKYPIENSILKPPSFGTRNLAKGVSFSIQTTGPVWVFLNYEK